MLFAAIIACTAGVSDPQATDCIALTSPKFFETQEVCEENIVNVGVPFIENRGLVVNEVMCVPVKSFDKQS